LVQYAIQIIFKMKHFLNVEKGDVLLQGSLDIVLKSIVGVTKVHRLLKWKIFLKRGGSITGEIEMRE